MKNQYDVIVVGAGPAGSTAAYILASRFNRKILLLDKAKFPRDKPCGGYLTKRVFTRFNYLVEDLKSMVEVPTHGSKFYGPDLSELEWINEDPVGYLVLRTKFDNYLKNLAIDHGATFLEGKAAKDIIINEEEGKVMLEDGSTYGAKLIIGADGVRSIVAKRSGIYEKLNTSSKGLCVVNEVKVREEFIDEIYGKERLTYYFYGFSDIIGYGWLFPKKNHINIGIGGPSSSGKEIGQVFGKFIEYLQDERMIPKDSNFKERFKASMIPTSTALYLKRTFSDRVVVAGDALGVASSVSGEGIYQSMASGEDAAITCNLAIENHQFDANFLQQYEKIWKKDLASELKMVGNIMQLGTSSDKAELVEKMQGFFKKMREERALFEYFINAFFGLS